MNCVRLVRRIVAWTALSSLVLAGPRAWAEKAEHPEHPEKKTTKPTVSLEDVAKAAEAYVKENSKDGKLQVHDEKEKKQLSLSFDKVHRERLSQTKGDEFFVCADFKTEDGKVYDLDFFIRGTSKDNLKVDDKTIAVHKVEGKERYTWSHNKEKDLWEKKAVGAKGEEHPEHPKK